LGNFTGGSSSLKISISLAGLILVYLHLPDYRVPVDVGQSFHLKWWAKSHRNQRPTSPEV